MIVIDRHDCIVQGRAGFDGFFNIDDAISLLDDLSVTLAFGCHVSNGLTTW